MKGLNIPDGTTVYIPAVRVKYDNDNKDSVAFRNSRGYIQFMNDDQFLTEEELKAKFNEWSSEKLPKQGEMIEVADGWYHWCTNYTFICMYGKKVLAIKNWEFETWDKWRYPKQKTELTLAEVEEKLGIEKGSLIIKD